MGSSKYCWGNLVEYKGGGGGDLRWTNIEIFLAESERAQASPNEEALLAVVLVAKSDVIDAIIIICPFSPLESRSMQIIQ